MAVTNTTNYSLAKPDLGTTNWHTYENGNMDIIDAALKTGTGANVLPKRDVNGNIPNIGNQITALSANTTLTPAQSGIINVTTGASVIIITLPTSVANAQLIYTIKKVDSGSGTVSIATTSSQTIDGVSSKTITNQNANITLVSDGANWIVDIHNILDKIGLATLTTTAQELNSAVNEVQQMPVNAMSRQAIINSNFDVWQRGTSLVEVNSALQFLADRWYTLFEKDTGATPPTVTHSRFTLNTGDLPNSFYGFRTNYASAYTFSGNGLHVMQQSIENGVRYLCGAGKKVTLSFWAKSDIVGKKIGISAFQLYGSGGSPSTAELIQGTMFTLTSTWTKYTVTFNTNTLVGKTFGTNNDDMFRVLIHHGWTAVYNSRFISGVAENVSGAGNIDISQVQVNAGDIALPFQPRDVDDEIKKSLRFAFIPQANSVFVRLTSYTANTLVFNVPLPTQMRIAPTIRGTINTDMIAYTMAAAAQSGFTAATTLTSNGVVVTLTKTAHGLTDGYLEIKTTSGFEAEL